MNNKINYIVTLLVSFTFLSTGYASDYEDPTIAERNISALNGDLAAIEEIQTNFKELRRRSIEEAEAEGEVFVAKRPLKLFEREAYEAPGTSQSLSTTGMVYLYIKEKRLENVDFDVENLYFDGRGTCTAMALDFLTRFMEESHTLNDRNSRRAFVRQFKPYYRASTTTFSSRQAAYNSIKVDREAYRANPELIKMRKMQSLANYHNLKLTAATPSIEVVEIEYKPKNFKKIIKNLPDGCYVVRALSPANNYKMEYYGHTMIFIKGKKFSAYYDNSDGAYDITGDVESYVTDKILSWYIPEVRLYKATLNRSEDLHITTEHSS